MINRDSRIGLAISGGGFRATAFGLGALRALHDRGLLRQVRVISGISGGSLLAAMWAYGPTKFSDFDANVSGLIAKGMQADLLRRTVSPQMIGESLRRNIPGAVRRQRAFSRTEALVAALRSMDFGSKLLAAVTHQDLHTVLSATDMATSNAIRFGSQSSSISALGRILEPVTVAEAVAASAAFPILLPALARRFTFEARDGTQTQRRILMTDGGVYDNLGISPLMPRRSGAHTSHVYDLDYLISVDAGSGRRDVRGGQYFVSRIKRSFEISHGRTQDSARSQLHEARGMADLSGFLHIYLGVSDERLPPLADLVPRGAAANYATNFAAMRLRDFEAITIRGEEIARLLLARHEVGA